jgi:hypothetical protein
MARTLVPVFVIASAALLLTGCGAETPTAGQPPINEASVEPGGNGQSGDKPAEAKPSQSTSPSKPSPGKTAASKKPQGPAIVYFRVKQKPKCAEGTAVFRAEAVPLIIEWKISGATSGALSVDDPTHTPGTYGPVELKGTQEFPFSCGGAVGTTEKHTYAIYTVGGGTQKSKTITAQAKVMDKGLGTTDGNG